VDLPSCITNAPLYGRVFVRWVASKYTSSLL
jgi:hypothetical protein